MKNRSSMSDGVGMYPVLCCSAASAVVLCYAVSMIIKTVSVPVGSTVIVLLMLAAVIDMMISGYRKTYCGISAALIAVLLHIIIAADKIRLEGNLAIGAFLLMMSLIMAFAYRYEHTLGNIPLYHDAVFGKRAGEISSVVQSTLSLTVLHSVLYTDSYIYTVICFAAVTFASVIAAYVIIYPEYKALKLKEARELKDQIKREQGYR